MASRRNYVTTTEVDDLIGSGASTDIQISEAEEIIDSFVGFQNKFLDYSVEGRASSATANSITLQQNQTNTYDVNFFSYCEIEILGGTGAGQRRVITSSTLAGVLTIATDWTNTPDSTSYYKIYQLGKFPRACDVTSYSEQPPTTYYKQIPENIKRATAAQVEYMTTMGADYFSTDKTEKVSESIGDYRYENVTSGGVGNIGASKLLAPKAKLFLKGFRNSTGQIVV